MVATPSPEQSPTQAGDRTPLQRWLRGIDDNTLPVLGGTIQELCNTAGNGGSSASDLATVVLRDVGLTSDIIRTANSAYFNPGGQPISTVSRAVVLLGFDTVRSIGLSLALLDSLVRGHGRERVSRLFAESMEAALCAQALGDERHDPAPEELFIAALLCRIGELAFWCFADDDTAARLDEAVAEANPAEVRECERACLGFSLRDLSRALAREWRLGDLTRDALRPGGPKDPRATMAHAAHGVVDLLHRQDRQGAARRLERMGRVDEETADRILERVRREAPVMAKALGVQPALREPPADYGRSEPDPPAANPQLQLRVLREMAVSVREGSDLQALFDLVAEGLFRGVGFDRCAVATLRRDGGLHLRSVLGDTGTLEHALRDGVPDASSAALMSPGRTTQLSREHRRNLPAPLRGALMTEVAVGPIRAGGRTLGVLMAESRGRDDAVDERLEGFDRFLEQLCLCLQQMIRQSR